MMKQTAFLLTILGMLAGFGCLAQKAETIKLDQTPGEFETTELTLKPGKYVFDVSNKGVDHAVGFVITPKGKTDQENHIKSSYLTKVIENGESAKSGEVSLEKGEYVYFCPLNPTPHYRLVVN
ncbi:plastocyanin/azurin family copper-binding protein [uncultured Imperialibacter sp.]|uniref:plastocyanin/azurin family copper-binding protein n=1 Tax=uncultured Imperialibacter sp. TaxID=1672639 RepID=UPI0030DD26F2|tara:strand:+ start:12948 stop:13316 length:369 start_codon:yes stop_codon:yes gene_type:complete